MPLVSRARERRSVGGRVKGVVVLWERLIRERGERRQAHSARRILAIAAATYPCDPTSLLVAVFSACYHCKPAQGAECRWRAHIKAVGLQVTFKLCASRKQGFWQERARRRVPRFTTPLVRARARPGAMRCCSAAWLPCMIIIVVLTAAPEPLAASGDHDGFGPRNRNVSAALANRSTNATASSPVIAATTLAATTAAAGNSTGAGIDPAATATTVVALGTGTQTHAAPTTPQAGGETRLMAHLWVVVVAAVVALLCAAGAAGALGVWLRRRARQRADQHDPRRRLSAPIMSPVYGRVRLNSKDFSAQLAQAALAHEEAVCAPQDRDTTHTSPGCALSSGQWGAARGGGG